MMPQSPISGMSMPELEYAWLKTLQEIHNKFNQIGVIHIEALTETERHHLVQNLRVMYGNIEQVETRIEELGKDA